MNKKPKDKSKVPEIAKILWYRHKVDNWPIKKISEIYNISKSTIYRWFKNFKDENIDESYIKFDLDSISSDIIGEYLFMGENILPREYFKSSFEVNKEDSLSKPTDLPEKYGFNYAFALPLDPYRIFIYWEILENKEIIIKIIDDTESDKLLHMILTSKYPVSNMYVPVGVPDRLYFADIFVLEDGKEKFIVRTNKVRTPRNSPASSEILSLYDWYNIDQTMFSISSFIINKM